MVLKQKGRAATVEDGCLPDFNGDRGDSDDDGERGDGVDWSEHYHYDSV